MLPFFFELLTRGLLLALQYSLMTIGLTIIYGIMKMTNFAHGAFYIAGAYLFWYFFPQLGVLSLPLSLAVILCSAFFLEKILLHPAFMGEIERPGEYALLITYALSLFTSNFVLEVFGPIPKMPPSLLTGNINVPYVNISVEGSRIVYSLVTVGTLLILLIFFNKTRNGRAFRAVAQNRIAAKIRGINDSNIASLSFALGCMLAALAGVFVTPILSLSAGAGWVPVMKGFIVLIVAGLGSIMGCIVASFILAFSEVLGNMFLVTLYRDIYGFIIMTLILIVRPHGLFGEVERRRA